jgi:hypothetical protein
MVVGIPGGIASVQFPIMGFAPVIGITVIFISGTDLMQSHQSFVIYASGPNVAGR